MKTSTKTNTRPRGPAQGALSLANKTASSRRRLVLLAAMSLLAVGGIVFWTLREFVNADFRQAEQALKQREFAAASAHLEVYLHSRPGDLKARLLSAQTLRQQGKFQLALSQLEIYAKQAGSDRAVRVEATLHKLQRGNLSEADQLLDQCLRDAHASETPLILEALIEGSVNSLLAAMWRERAGEGVLSLREFLRAQKAIDAWLGQSLLQADQSQGFVWRGKLFSIARDYPKSVAAFRQALAVNPNNAEARELLGLLLAHEVPHEAITHLELAQRQSPESAKVRRALVSVRRNLGQLEPARQLLDELLARYPNDVALLVERGCVALDLQRPEDAERWLREAVSKSPDNAQANLMLSHCLRQMGQEVEARHYHDKFLGFQIQQPERQRDS